MASTGVTMAFSQLSELIKDWLASTRLTHSLVELNHQLGIRGENKLIIPILINRLVTLDLNPRDFVNTLSESLEIGQSAAQVLTREIEQRALHPIEEELKKELGLDIALLHFPAAPQTDFKELVGELGNASEDRVSVPAPQPATPLDTERFIDSPRAPEIAPENEAKPFILHQEKEEIKPIAQPPRPTFSIRIPLAQKKYAPLTPSVKARIETGGEGQIANRKSQIAENNQEIASREPRNDESGGAMPLPRPPLGPLGARIANSEALIANRQAQIANRNEQPKNSGGWEITPGKFKGQPDFKIKLKPIMGEPKRPGPDPLVKRVVNYSHWYTPLE